MGRMFYSLRHDFGKSADLDLSVPSYRSYENPDNWFTLDDDGFDKFDELEVEEASSPKGESDKSSWYRRKSFLTSGDEVVPVGFDDKDDTVIVMDEMDIYKVPKKSLPDGDEEPTEDEDAQEIFREDSPKPTPEVALLNL
jgi:hypothetical protein